jgi:hypothetical protein
LIEKKKLGSDPSFSIFTTFFQPYCAADIISPLRLDATNLANGPMSPPELAASSASM